MDQFDEVFRNPHGTVGGVRIRPNSRLMALNQFGQCGPWTVAIEGPLFVRRDDVEISTGSNYTVPFLKRLDGVRKMLNAVRANHKIDTGVLERQLISWSDDVDRQKSAAHFDFLFLEDRHAAHVVDVAGLEAKWIMSRPADLYAFESVKQLMSERTFSEFHTI